MLTLFNMKIFDCTTYFDEKMLMDVRFNVLDEYVHKFIVVESIYSHSGEKKNLNFDINLYPKFKDKIEYLVIEEEPKNLASNDEIVLNPHLKRLNSIKRIEQSYNYMKKGISSAQDEDLILISDNDEIPNLDSNMFKTNKNSFILFKQFFFYYKFNYLYDRMVWFGTKGCKKKKFSKFSNLRNLKNKKYPFWRLDTFFSNLKQTDINIINDGGWHFTNLKSAEDLYIKLKNFGHHDEFDLSGLSINDLKNKIDRGIVFYDHFADKSSKEKWNFDYKLKKIKDDMLPEYLVNNKNKFKDWFVD